MHTNNDGASNASFATGGSNLSSSADSPVAASLLDKAGYERAAGGAELRLGSTDVHIDFHVFVDGRNGIPGTCDFYGAAYIAS